MAVPLTTSLPESKPVSRTPTKTVTDWIGRTCGVLLDAIVRGLALTKIPPNYLTFFGLVVNSLAAVFFGYGKFFWAGVVIFLAGIFDMTDGRVARVTNQVSVFGGFFDSVAPVPWSVLLDKEYKIEPDNKGPLRVLGPDLLELETSTTIADKYDSAFLIGPPGSGPVAILRDRS